MKYCQTKLFHMFYLASTSLDYWVTFRIEVTSSSIIFKSVLGGLLLFGWLGAQFVQRKIFVIVGTLTALMASGAFMVSSEYWMLLPAKFLQGLSNACIWLMCSALIADIWPLSKLGSMVGLICGIFSLGMSSGLILGGKMKCVIFRHA